MSARNGVGTDAADFARCMGPVALEVLGEPAQRSKGELRWGTRGSLCVDTSKGTWHDHEANEGGGVLDFVQRQCRLDKADALAWLHQHGHLPRLDRPKAASKREITAYPYLDADGRLLFQVVRFDPKDFRQRRPDGSGGWAWNMQDVPRVPYCLPDLIAAVKIGRIVHVVEGEKAADALRALGLTATCSPGGAGKWRAEYNPVLDGASVVILPDHDEPGRAHADQVAAHLRGHAVRIRRVELPGLPPKGDVVDWLAAGGTSDLLLELGRNAPLLPAGLEAAESSHDTSHAKATDQAPLAFINPATLWGKAVPQRKWIVEGWLPVGTVTVLFGDGGTGKSLLAQQLMTSCAMGRRWCGLQVEQCRTLALFCEDDADELHRRQDCINASLGITFDDLGDNVLWRSGVGMNNILAATDQDGIVRPTEAFAQLRKAIEQHKPGLVPLDTAADLFAGNENNRLEVRQFMNLLGGLGVEFECSILLNAHPSRAGMATGNHDGGSTAWSNTARSRWSLAHPMADNGESQPDANERILTRRKANYAAKGDTINLRWASGVLAPLTQQGQVAGPIARQRAEQVFLTLLDQSAQQGVTVSHNSRSGSYAPKVFAKHPGREGYKVPDFLVAMNALMNSRKIRVGSRLNASRHPVECLVREEPDGEP